MAKQKMWLLALGVAAVMTAGGLVMAVSPVGAQDAAGKEKAPFAQKRDGCKGERRGPGDNKELLAFLKIDAKSLAEARKEGKTLAAVAADQGISETQLKAFLVKQMNDRLDAGVEKGRLTQEQAEKMKQNAEERVSAMINGKGPMHGPGHKGGPAPFDKDALLSLLKMDDQTLRSELKAGKTFAAIASEQGVSEQELKDFFLTQMNARIDAGLKDGRLSAERAEQMKKHAEERVSDMINGKGPMQKADCRDGKRKG